MEIVMFRIPAFSQQGARQRARANARVKGMKGGKVDTIDDVGSADIPGQQLYYVTLVSEN